MKGDAKKTGGTRQRRRPAVGAYAAEITAAFQALDENNLDRAIDLLDRQRPKPGEEDLRGFEWRHLWQLCQSDAKATFRDAGAHDPAFSPDGRWLAYGGDQIVIRELPSQAVVKTIPIAAMTLAFSPDGKLLASGHDSHVRLWSTESWEEEQTLPDARYPAVFSPDGQWLVTGAVGRLSSLEHQDVAAGGLLSGRARARLPLAVGARRGLLAGRAAPGDRRSSGWAKGRPVPGLGFSLAHPPAKFFVASLSSSHPRSSRPIASNC